MAPDVVNITIGVPHGTVNHGNPQLICTPPAWYDYAIFYLTNYFAHAFTVVAFPGQGNSETILTMFLSLLLPGCGIAAAMKALTFGARFYSKDPLKQALRAGALCMVVKNNKLLGNASVQQDTELGRMVGDSGRANRPGLDDGETTKRHLADDNQTSNPDDRYSIPLKHSFDLSNNDLLSSACDQPDPFTSIMVGTSRQGRS